MQTMNKSISNERLLTPEQLAQLLQVPKATLYKWRSENRGPKGIKIGKHVRYPFEGVHRWLADMAGEL